MKLSRHIGCFLVFFTMLIGCGVALSGGMNAGDRGGAMETVKSRPRGANLADGAIKIFLCGDVMTGRGIDQVMPHPVDPTIHEPYMRDARGYVEIAEQANGPIKRPVDFSWIWGDAKEELSREAPDIRIINLETSITTSDDYWKGKGINYRMNPLNIPCITAAGIHISTLANNHVVDWGYAGLLETLNTLKSAKVKTAGAGRSLVEARAPAVLNVEGKGRVVVYSFGFGSSGIPREWAAGKDKPGVNRFDDLSARTARRFSEAVSGMRQEGDIIVASIHWGGNWGYHIPREHRTFARMLIDDAGVDLVHGHSSHHVKGIEVYREKPILYGCGDFINDYEGIGGYEEFRGDLSLMYFVTMDPTTGKLLKLSMTPLRIRNFKVNRASGADALWLAGMLTREGKALGNRTKVGKDNTLTLNWGRPSKD